MKYPNLLPLDGVIQDYAWGGYQYIPNLIGQENPNKHPQAELWMGAHNRGPAQVKINDQINQLDEWIASDPIGVLGESVAKRFQNSLPFLFKILDVRKMLSIQAHPTKTAAMAGFERENAAGIPLSARHRNYKDDNHKPEIMVALSDFWLLHGFRSTADIEQLLETHIVFQQLQNQYAKGGIRGLYQHIMELAQKEVDQLLEPLAVCLGDALGAGDLDRSQPDYWAAHAFRDYTKGGHYDRGIFSVYLFNLVHLKTGEGIFQDANVPHAYLEGINVELMANSDNVFRGGLTAKHVDVNELMQHLLFESVNPKVLAGEKGLEHERIFITPAPDFELSQISLKKGETFLKKRQEGPAIYILISGKVVAEIGEMGSGCIFFSPHRSELKLEGLEKTLVFCAGVPLNEK